MKRRVLLVGATDGIGRALASRYVSGDRAVAVVGRDPEKLRRVIDRLRRGDGGGRAMGVRCDVTDRGGVPEAFDRALEKLGGLELLVYCAGVRTGGRTAEERYAASARMLDVNLAGAIHFLELAADHFAAEGGGHLAAIGSVAGDWARPRDPAYGASKAGLHAYLSGLRMRLRGSGVRVSTIKPGSVNTRMLSGEPPGAIEPEDAARRIERGLSAGREEFYVPGWWRLVSLGLRLAPRWLLRRIITR